MLSKAEASPAPPGIPHVNDCNFCQKCHITAPLAFTESGPARVLQQTSLNLPQHLNSRLLLAPSFIPSSQRPFQVPDTRSSQALLSKHNKFGPTAAEGLAKDRKPNCTECHGCSVELLPLQNVSAFGHSIKLEKGNSPQYIYLVDLPGGDGKKAVVKIWCIPLHKFFGHHMGWQCSKAHEGPLGVAHLLGMQRVLEDCGLQVRSCEDGAVLRRAVLCCCATMG